MNTTSSDLSFNAELTVIETIFGPRITFVGISPDTHLLTLQFEAVAGLPHTVHAATHLALEDWIEVSRVRPAETDRIITVDIPADTEAVRFFRVQSQ